MSRKKTSAASKPSLASKKSKRTGSGGVGGVADLDREMEAAETEASEAGAEAWVDEIPEWKKSGRISTELGSAVKFFETGDESQTSTKNQTKNKSKKEAPVFTDEEKESKELEFEGAALGDLDFIEEQDSDEASEALEMADEESEGELGNEDAVGLELVSDIDLEGTELENFESAQIDDIEKLSEEQIQSIVESVLFSTDKPISVALIKQTFKGTSVRSKDIREALDRLREEYNPLQRGVSLEEVAGGFQLRTKPDNMKFLRQSVKARPFKLSGPALEVLSIVAYKQPVTKSQIDEIRGVESGHLLRALMEKSLVTFGERSDLPGKPMFYESTRKFLEIFGLRNLNELPSIHEIDQLIPEGIGEVEDKETLSDLTGSLSQAVGISYSEGEDELLKITDELTQITTSSAFFEEEKRRMRDKRDQERAQNIREAIAVGEAVEDKDRRWLERFEAGLVEQAHSDKEVEFVAASAADSAPALAEESTSLEFDPNSEEPSHEL